LIRGKGGEEGQGEKMVTDSEDRRKVPRECESLEPEKQNAEQRGNGWKSKRTF
jgi:hypothetical protein